MVDPQLNYGSRDEAEHRPRRSAATWAKLLIVWSVGLVVWAFYLMALAWLWIKVM